MASAFSHIAVPIALMIAGKKSSISWRLVLLGVILSVAPDFDVIAFKFGIPYESQWGHRGFTHSIVFSLTIALLCSAFSRKLLAKPKTVFLFSFFSMISHALLDGLTNGGLGVALFWPFDHGRYFLPWKVIEVSPISISRFFTERGLTVIQSELLYIWLPCILLVLIVRRVLK